MQQVVSIEIENGVPTITVQGVKGPACKNLTKGLEAALGEVTKSEPTKEMYEKQTQTVKARN